eukprot:1195878-Prorocentrum_minimum.AAC.2
MDIHPPWREGRRGPVLYEYSEDADTSSGRVFARKEHRNVAGPEATVDARVVVGERESETAAGGVREGEQAVYAEGQL